MDFDIYNIGNTYDVTMCPVCKELLFVKQTENIVDINMQIKFHWIDKPYCKRKYKAYLKTLPTANDMLGIFKN